MGNRRMPRGLAVNIKKNNISIYNITNLMIFQGEKIARLGKNNCAFRVIFLYLFIFLCYNIMIKCADISCN